MPDKAEVVTEKVPVSLLCGITWAVRPVMGTTLPLLG